MTSQSILSDFFSLFFPDYCFGCRGGLSRGEEILCTNCLAEIPILDYDPKRNPIVDRFLGHLPIAQAWALLKFQKAGIVQNLMHDLKYNSKPEIGVKLGKLLATKVKAGEFCRFDLIVPIPLHKNRLRTRGYNQSNMIAQGLSEVLQVPYQDGHIIRQAATQTQTKKSKLDRLENVRQSFQVVNPEALANKDILLVDDVITTGATLEACAEKILKAGAAAISIACLAEVQ